MIHRKYSHLIICLFIICLFVVGIILFSNGTNVFANLIVQDVNDTLPQANAAYNHFSTARHNYIVTWVSLERLDMERAALQVQYKSNKTTMQKEAFELAAAASPKSIIPADYVFNVSDIAANAAKMAISASDAVDLQKKLVAKNLEIQKQLVVVAEHKETVDTTYTHYVDHINAFNAANKRNKISPSANVTAADKGYIPPEDGKDGVSVDSNLSVDCGNPKCSTSYSASVYGLANIVALSDKHKVTCSIPHDTYNNVPDPVIYWNCPDDPNDCPWRHIHKVLCGGGCGNYFSSWNNPHKVWCNERVPSLVFPWSTIDCNGHYYSCNGDTSADCWNAGNHTGGSSTNPVVSPDPPPTPATPSASLSASSSSVSVGDSVSFSLTTTTAFSQVYWYVAGPGVSGLGTHVETDSGGSSSTSASFSYTLSDSGSYTITAYIYNYSDNSTYETSSTVEVSPVVEPINPVVVPAPPPPTITPNPPPPPPPAPTPTLVSCSGCNASYDPDSSSAVNLHRLRTCRFSECRQTWRRCQSGAPLCLKPYRQKNGLSCYAEE